ncbi:hypothetical protein BC940DRAFT_311852 [Gongronella butleri]|nr:hypothetical protein BC940DRAFT_311852 [Gongronella butleri]
MRVSHIVKSGLAFALHLTAAAAGTIKPQNCTAIASAVQELYTYTYPLVLMNTTSANTIHSALTSTIKMNVDNHFVVKMNLDTSYIQGFFDLDQHSYTLTIPPHGNRYWIAQFLDAFSNTIGDPGSRYLNGEHGYTFGLIGPKGSKHHLPANATIVESTTSLSWIIGRIYHNGTTADEDLVSELVKQWVITQYPLHSSLPIAVTATVIDNNANINKTSPVTIVNTMAAEHHFDTAASLLCKNPPAKADRAFIKRMKKEIGFTPCSKTAFKQPARVYECLTANFTTQALSSIAAQTAQKAVPVTHNGWPMWLTGIGTYGTDYVFRATVALVGLGANLPEDAIYPSAVVDSTGAKLNASLPYTLTFTKDQMPPADAFWSITFYNSANFLEPNTIDRYALRSADNLTKGSDGSLTLYIQPDAPKDESTQSNWLPSQTTGPYTLTLRLYNPQPQVLNGTWVPPAIIKSSEPA